jgi:Mg2+-importing ATPase
LQRSARWFAWLLGAAAVAAVVVVALHLSEEKEIARLFREARPAWLAVAFALQALTYWAQAGSWRVVTRAAKAPLGAWQAVRLSLAKLFIDQVLPSTGISGTVVVAQALMAKGLPAAVVMASVMVDFVGFHVAEDVGLAAAVIVAAAAGKAGAALIITAAVFFVLSAAQAVVALVLSGRQKVPALLRRIKPLEQGVRFMETADPKLTRNALLVAKSSVLQLVVVALDVATMWVLIRSLGSNGHIVGVFASFMISTLLRTLSITPGGLGAFEAASTFSLKLAGVPLPVALSATLLFRGLSFWLPMLPGLLFARPLRNAEAR